MDALRDVGRQARPQPQRLRQEARGHAGLRHLRRDVQRRRRDRALPGACAACSPRRASSSPRASCRPSPCGTRRCCARSCPPRACATSPRSPTPSVDTTRRPRRMPPTPVACSGSSSWTTSLAAAGHEDHAVDALLAEARKALPAEVEEAIERWPAVVESYAGDEQVVRIRDKEPAHVAGQGVAERQQDPPRLGAVVRRPR